ncbi:DMT family transporter [Derxia gummosa]|uniref:DMT family transporter n=1 Tax=Derxia gummosa DSM 723 TaxID=1121388 RepID=A0A9U5FVA3_9BURK|nr:DMT family transporter [Derxia gummosa]
MASAAADRGDARPPLLPFLILLAGGSCIGFAAIFVRLSETGPVASAFWRMAIAAPVLALLAARCSSAAATSPAAAMVQTGSTAVSATVEPVWRDRAVWATAACFAADLAVWHFSIVFTTVANATLLANFAPIVLTLGLWWLRGQRPGARFALGGLLALAGAAALTRPGAASAARPDALVGDALGLATAFFYAGYMVALKQARARHDALRLMAWSSAFSAALLLPVALGFAVLTGSPLLPASGSGWSLLLALALVTQVAGQTLIAQASAHLPVALASLTLLVQPLVAALAGWAIFGEALGPAQIAGGVAILCGVQLARANPAAETVPGDEDVAAVAGDRGSPATAATSAAATAGPDLRPTRTDCSGSARDGATR